MNDTSSESAITAARRRTLGVRKRSCAWPSGRNSSPASWMPQTTIPSCEQAVQIRPHELERDDRVDGAVAEALEAVEQAQHAREQHEGHELRARLEADGDDEQHQRQRSDAQPRALAAPADRGEHREQGADERELGDDHRGMATGCVQRVQPELEEPVDVDPGHAGSRVGEHVAHGHLARLDDQLARAQVPPVVERADVLEAERRGQREQRGPGCDRRQPLRQSGSSSRRPDYDTSWKGAAIVSSRSRVRPQRAIDCLGSKTTDASAAIAS